MSITKEQVIHVAALSKLKISADAEEKMMKDMQFIIEFANQLNQLDTEGVVPSAHAIPIHNVFREDVVMPSADREDLLGNAPTVEDGCYLVPKIVE